MLTAEQNLVVLEDAPSPNGRPLSEDEKWKAVLARDESFDGLFVLGVRSTGVYCKPSCPARRPAWAQAMFFRGPLEAELAGFRACLRCKPRDLVSPKTRLIDQACKYIESNLQQRLTLSVLSRQVGLSQYHFQRTFRRVLGVSPRQYVESRRLAKMKHHLRNGETVNESLYRAGFSSRSRVYENVSGLFGVNPGEFRRGGQGLQIRYEIIQSPLGRLLIASTEKGVCGVCIGDSDKVVEEAIHEDYPHATLVREERRIDHWTRAFSEYLNGQHHALDVPIDVKATAFQRRVWKLICSIPYGETATYSQIASKMGNPEATRAVANACASNPVALVIPCHRVVSKDGELRGYRWGKSRKRALLEMERKFTKRIL